MQSREFLARRKSLRTFGGDAVSDADQIRALIDTAGLSQRGASRELGVSERLMRYWIAGERPVPRAIILALTHLAQCGGGDPPDILGTGI